jgi:hypothetical protein
LEEVDWIAQLEYEMYSSDAIPKHILAQWYAKNPSGFSILKTNDGEKVGHIDILPIHPTILQRFIDGDILERDIRGDDLYSLADKGLIRSLYVESVAVSLSSGHSKGPAVLYLICNLSEAIERICDPGRIDNVYAIAATTEGSRFLSRLGFEIHKKAESRRDHHNLFIASYPELKKAASNMCQRRYAPDHKLRGGSLNPQ